MAGGPWGRDAGARDHAIYPRGHPPDRGGCVVTAPAARRYEAGLDAARAGLPCPSKDPMTRHGWAKATADAKRAARMVARMSPALSAYARALAKATGGAS